MFVQTEICSRAFIFRHTKILRKAYVLLSTYSHDLNKQFFKRLLKKFLTAADAVTPCQYGCKSQI